MFQSLAQNESIKNRESQKLLKSILFQKLLIDILSSNINIYDLNFSSKLFLLVFLEWPKWKFEPFCHSALRRETRNQRMVFKSVQGIDI